MDLAHKIALDNPNLNKKNILNVVVPYILRMEVERDLDFMEYFSGKAEVTKALRRKLFQGYGLDEKYSNMQDVNTICGRILLAP